MKISQLMLDLGTGDVNEHDAYVQEAYGRIKVSSAIYNATSKIAELPEGEYAIIQEAADAGLPTNTEDACNVSCQAVKKSVTALLDMIAASAKSIKQATDKDMKLLVGVGKKYGVSMGEDFIDDFAKPLVKAIFQENGNKKIELGGNKFIKGNYAEQIADCYTTGITTYIVALGLDAQQLFDLKIVESYLNGVPKKKPDSFKTVSKYLRDASKDIKFDKSVEKDRHYTSSIKQQDLLDLIISVAMVNSVAKTVIAVCNASAKKQANANLDALCSDDCSDKKITKAVSNIGENIASWGGDIDNIVNNIKKAYSDSVYSLVETLNNASKA